MLYDCKRISYWIDRRLTGLAGPDYAATISFGLPLEPEDSQYGKSRIRSLLALPRALLAPPRIESTDQAEGMMPVSERVRPEPRWPGIHHRSLRSQTPPKTVLWGFLLSWD